MSTPLQALINLALEVEDAEEGKLISKYFQFLSTS